MGKGIQFTRVSNAFYIQIGLFCYLKILLGLRMFQALRASSLLVSIRPKYMRFTLFVFGFDFPFVNRKRIRLFHCLQMMHRKKNVELDDNMGLLCLHLFGIR